MTDRPRVVCVVGKKRSGKTTTVVGLVRELAHRGLVVMTAKHGHGFDLDAPGTDSWRHRREGGAARVLLAGPDEMAVTGSWGRSGEPALEELVDRWLGDADVVVAEGFRASSERRVEVYRRAVHDHPWTASDPRHAELCIAFLTDTPERAPEGIPALDVDAPDRFVRLADLLVAALGLARTGGPG